MTKTLYSVSWTDGSVFHLGEGEWEDESIPGFMSFRRSNGDLALLRVEEIRAIIEQAYKVKEKKPEGEDGKVLPFQK